jgi:hypothetical protein
MPVCDWCHQFLRGLSNTGRPRRYRACSPLP